MNKVQLVGRLSKDPEAKTTQNGKSVTTLTVAVTRNHNKEQTDFLRVITWEQLADNCGKYLVNGQRVAVVGEIQNRQYEKDGQKRYVTEIVADRVEFLDKPQQTAASASPYGQSYQPTIFSEEPESQIYDEEDIPF